MFFRQNDSQCKNIRSFCNFFIRYVKTNLVAFGGHEIKLIVNDATKSTIKLMLRIISSIILVQSEKNDW